MKSHNLIILSILFLGIMASSTDAKVHFDYKVRKVSSQDIIIKGTREEIEIHFPVMHYCMLGWGVVADYEINKNKIVIHGDQKNVLGLFGGAKCTKTRTIEATLKNLPPGPYELDLMVWGKLKQQYKFSISEQGQEIEFEKLLPDPCPPFGCQFNE